MFCVGNVIRTRSATTATSTGISQGTAEGDAAPGLAPTTEIVADTHALDRQETDVMTGTETTGEETDHQTVVVIAETASNAETIVTTGDATIVTAVVTVQTVEMSGVEEIGAEAQTETGEGGTAQDAEAPRRGMREGEHLPEKPVNTHFHFYISNFHLALN